MSWAPPTWCSAMWPFTERAGPRSEAVEARSKSSPERSIPRFPPRSVAESFESVLENVEELARVLVRRGVAASKGALDAGHEGFGLRHLVLLHDDLDVVMAEEVSLAVQLDQDRVRALVKGDRENVRCVLRDVVELLFDLIRIV